MAADPDSRVKDVLDDILTLVGAGGSGVPLRGSDTYNELAVGTSTLSRGLAQAAAAVTLSSGSFRLSFFTALRSFTSTQAVVYVGATAAGATPTLVRYGLYSVAADGAGTLVASTANDTALLAAPSTSYAKAWSSPVAVTAGSRYAMGLLVVTGAAAPVMWGATQISSTPSVPTAVAPRVSGLIAAQADLPGSFTDAGLSPLAGRFYAAILP